MLKHGGGQRLIFLWFALERLSNYIQSRSGEIASYLQKQIPNMGGKQQKGGGGFTFISPRDAKEAAANAFSQKND